MESWPSTLPQDFLIGASITDDESCITSQMDAGPASVRNRFTAISKTVKTGLVITGAQLATFNTFIRTTLQNGSLTFTWIMPDTGASASIRFKKKPEWTCIKPSADVNSRIWRADLEIEVLP